jgi:hypothetical protein
MFVYLCSYENINPIEEDAVHTAPKIFLVSQKDFVEVAHTTHEDPEVDVQLVKPTGKMNSAKKYGKNV